MQTCNACSRTSTSFDRSQCEQSKGCNVIGKSSVGGSSYMSRLLIPLMQLLDAEHVVMSQRESKDVMLFANKGQVDMTDRSGSPILPHYIPSAKQRGPGVTSKRRRGAAESSDDCGSWCERFRVDLVHRSGAEQGTRAYRP